MKWLNLLLALVCLVVGYYYAKAGNATGVDICLVVSVLNTMVFWQNSRKKRKGRYVSDV